MEAKLLSTKDGSEILSHNTPGELYIRSPSVTNLGYLNNPRASAETFGEDGWLRTGDEAMIVSNSHRNGGTTEHLKIVDRIKELIKFKVIFLFFLFPSHFFLSISLAQCLLTVSFRNPGAPSRTC